LTTPVVVLTFAFMRAVVMVKVPAASVTQNGVGVSQVLLTDSDVLLGSALADVYATRKMSSLHTCSFIFPVPRVKVTPVGSTTNAVLVGVGVAQVTGAPPLPPWPPSEPALPPPGLPALFAPAAAPPRPSPAMGALPPLAPWPARPATPIIPAPPATPDAPPPLPPPAGPVPPAGPASPELDWQAAANKPAIKDIRNATASRAIIEKYCRAASPLVEKLTMAAKNDARWPARAPPGSALACEPLAEAALGLGNEPAIAIGIDEWVRRGATLQLAILGLHAVKLAVIGQENIAGQALPDGEAACEISSDLRVAWVVDQ